MTRAMITNNNDIYLLFYKLLRGMNIHLIILIILNSISNVYKQIKALSCTVDCSPVS